MGAISNLINSDRFNRLPAMGSYLRRSINPSRIVVRPIAAAAGMMAAALFAVPPGSVYANVEAEKTKIGLAGDVDSTQLPGASPVVAQVPASTESERPGSSDKIERAARKKGQPNTFGQATKPTFFTQIEQSTNWAFPRTGANWGNGAAVGSTFVGLGYRGSINGTKDNLFDWSVQLGPSFQHTFNVPSNDRTPLRIDLFGSLSPLEGNDLNIYVTWRGLFGTDVIGEQRVQNTVRTGIIYSFAGSRIIPDAIETINLPERGFYARVEPGWIFGVNGQLGTVQTQAYLGWSDTLYPFTFAIEVGPQFIQAAGRDLQTILGSFFDLGYTFNKKTRAYIRYRPALSFGGNEYPAAGQILQAGVNYRF